MLWVRRLSAAKMQIQDKIMTADLTTICYPTYCVLCDQTYFKEIVPLWHCFVNEDAMLVGQLRTWRDITPVTQRHEVETVFTQGKKQSHFQKKKKKLFETKNDPEIDIDVCFNCFKNLNASNDNDAEEI